MKRFCCLVYVCACMCVYMEQKTVGVFSCLHCAHLLINLAPGCIKHHTLQNRYKDVIEHRQQSMTEQALSERQRERESVAPLHSLFND